MQFLTPIQETRETFEATISTVNYWTFAETSNNPGEFSAFFKITVTSAVSSSIHHTLFVMLTGGANSGISLTVHSSLLSASGSASGIYYIRSVTPKALNNGSPSLIDFYTYDTTQRDITIEVIYASGITFITPVVSKYNSTLQTSKNTSVYYAGTITSGSFYGALANNAPSATCTYYSSSNAGEALSTNNIIYLAADNKWYKAAVNGAQIPVNALIASCGSNYAINAAVGAYSMGYRGKPPEATSIVVSKDVFLRGNIDANGVFISDGTITSDFAADYSYLRVGICMNTSYVYFDGNNRIYTVTSRGISTIDNHPLDAQSVEGRSSSDIVLAPGGISVSISNQDLNTITATGFYRGSSMTNAPDSGWWYVVVESHNNLKGLDVEWVKQTITAYGASNSVENPTGTTYMRFSAGTTTWSSWYKVWNEISDGSGSGLDSDKLDGQDGAYYTDITTRLGYTPVDKAGDTMTGTLTLNGDPTAGLHAATKQYVDSVLSANDAMVYKGVVDCSTSPNYPAGTYAGWTYRVSVAGKIGGTSGINVEINDMLICLVDGTPAGNQATVGSKWTIIQSNIDGAVIGPSSSVANRIATFNNTTGKLLKDSGYLIGNASGNVPLSNGTVNANFNADKLDGLESTDFAASVHSHTILDVTGLSDSLTNKAAAIHTHSLNTLNGVLISGLTTDDVLKWDGSNWVNDAPSGNTVSLVHSPNCIENSDIVTSTSYPKIDGNYFTYQCSMVLAKNCMVLQAMAAGAYYALGTSDIYHSIAKSWFYNGDYTFSCEVVGDASQLYIEVIVDDYGLAWAAQSFPAGQLQCTFNLSDICTLYKNPIALMIKLHLVNSNSKLAVTKLKLEKGTSNTGYCPGYTDLGL